MKSLLAVASVGYAMDTQETAIRLAHLNFVARYGKSFASREHMESRYDVFKTNYKEVHETN